MPRWLRVVRGMLGTGITFAAGVGVVVGLIGVGAMIFGQLGVVELLQTVGKFSVASFILGVAFSGVLALAARFRRDDRLSLPMVAGVGSGAGLLYWIFLALTGGRAWSPMLAVENFVLLQAMGIGAASVMLLIARRARSAIGASEDPESLTAGEDEVIIPRRDATHAKVRQERE